MDNEVVLSIVISTCNRCEQLRRCLLSLADLQAPAGGRCEIIVVDNNSSDATRATVEACGGCSPHPVRYVFERRQGITHARNTGVRSSRGRFIASTDDDCLAAPDWATVLVEEFARQPSAGVIGGRVALHDSRDAPLATRISQQPHDVRSLPDVFGFMIGCNLAFRRDVFDTVAGYDVDLGRPGMPAGEDVDLVYRALRLGVRVRYSPRPLIFHAHGRRTTDQIRAARRSYARAKGAVYFKHLAAGDWHLLRPAYWELAGSVGRMARRGKSHRPAGDDLRFVLDFVAGGVSLLARRALAPWNS
jgi:GT2 family glycosyltransferase